MQEWNTKNWWQKAKISTICEEIVDCLNRTAPKVSYNTGYKMIRTSNIKDWYIDIEHVNYVTQETFNIWTRRSVPMKWDILLTREAPLWEIWLVRTTNNIFLWQRIVSYRVNPSIADNKFVYYSLLAPWLQAQIRSFWMGSTVEHMRVPDTKELILTLPPIWIQRKISAFLSNYDDLIENNNRRIQILEQTAQELYKEWFVNFRFPWYEAIKLIDSGSDFWEIPEGWKVEILWEKIKLIKGVSYKSSELSDDQGVDFINLKCFNRWGWFRIDGLKKYTWKFKESQNIKVWDIVMAVTDMTQNREVVARVALVPRTKEINQFTLSCDVIKIDPIGISKDYLYFVLRFSEFSGIYKARANWANVLHLRPDEIKDFTFLLPTPKILEKFIEIIANITQEIDVLNIKIDNLKKTRDLLLPKLISWEIDVSELEIN